MGIALSGGETVHDYYEMRRALLQRLFILGLSHKTAPLGLRELLHVPPAGLPAALISLAEVPHLQEHAIVSTCNRFEVYGTSADLERARGAIEAFLCRRSGLLLNDLRGSLYFRVAEGCVDHTFRVASSLDSMVLGESQVLGQVKDAFQSAMELRATGPVLNALFARAIHVAKRVRTDTSIATTATSVAGAAVELAKKIFGDLGSSTTLLLGAGEMAELAARRLADEGVRSMQVSTRHLCRAEEVACRLGATPIAFAGLQQALAEVDIVISSTAAPHYVIRPADVAGIMRMRRNRPLFMIDIAVPRDIDPAVAELDNVYVYDIDDLQAVVAQNLAYRRREVEQAENILVVEVQRFVDGLRSHCVVPV
ncbi:MAG: glutamyl-tRNA reductase, partial [Acidobacteriota bacterium]